MKYLIKRITLYQTKIETRGGPYASLHNANIWSKELHYIKPKYRQGEAHMHHCIMPIRQRGMCAILYVQRQGEAHMHHCIMPIRRQCMCAILYVQYIYQLSPNLLLVAMSEQWQLSWNYDSHLGFFKMVIS